MVRSGGAAMGDDDPNNQSEDGSDVREISVPTHTPLPQPPDITYTRPIMGRPAAGSKSDATSNPGGSDTREHGSAAAGRDLANHGAALAAGLSFVVSILAGAVIGNWIDHRWNHTQVPWATLVMILVGAAVGFLNLQRMVARMNRNQK